MRVLSELQLAGGGGICGAAGVLWRGESVTVAGCVTGPDDKNASVMEEKLGVSECMWEGNINGIVFCVCGTGDG